MVKDCPQPVDMVQDIDSMVKDCPQPVDMVQVALSEVWIVIKNSIDTYILS